MTNINPKKQILIVYIVLILVTFAVFWQVNQFDFVYDDIVYVTGNSHIQSGITLDGLRWAFSTTYAEFWHPLTWLSLMFDYQLHGLNAGAYHLTNLVLHILSTLLLFWLFNRMTGAIWKSAFVAAFFALHPLHVESVAWIAERKDVLSAFWGMLTLCLYVYYTEKPIIRRYLLVLFGFVCALMSKSMVITLPVIMILLDYWPLSRFRIGIESKKDKLFLWQLKEKLPFFILSAVFVIITIYAHNKQHSKIYPLSYRLTNAPVAFVTYLGKTFLPHDMAIFYPFSEHLPLWQVLGATLLIIIISVVVIVMMKRQSYLFVGWLWYAITILPVIGIIQIGDFAMADRYIYLPSIGISIMLAWGIPLLFPNENISKKVLFPVGIAAIVILAILTWQQCGYWKNSITLFRHALQVTKDNYVAHINLGLALFPEGKVEEAIYHYNRAINIAPDYSGAYNNRGGAYMILGQYQHAIEDYNETIRLKPDLASAYYNRGFVYSTLGKYQRAVEDYNEAIRLQPYYALFYNNRGAAYLKQGNKEQGCRDAQKACAWGDCDAIKWAKGQGYCR